MRRFRDRDGTDWDAVLGRESWGTVLVLFVPVVAGAAPVRQAPLSGSAYDTAVQELDGLDDAGLQELLDRSVIRDEGQP
jgi:hypothetical protein